MPARREGARSVRSSTRAVLSPGGDDSGRDRRKDGSRRPRSATVPGTTARTYLCRAADPRYRGEMSSSMLIKLSFLGAATCATSGILYEVTGPAVLSLGPPRNLIL